MTIEEAKLKYNVVVELTNWVDRIYGAYLVLFKGFLPFNGEVHIHHKGVEMITKQIND